MKNNLQTADSPTTTLYRTTYKYRMSLMGSQECILGSDRELTEMFFSQCFLLD